MKKGKKFQPCPINNDNDVAQMLEMYNRFEMDEVELFLEQIHLHLLVNSPFDNLSPLLLGVNDDKGDMQLSISKVVTYRTIQIQKIQMTQLKHHNCNFICHHHCNLKKLKTLLIHLSLY